MEAPNLYEWALGAGTGLIGWLARMVYADVKELRSDLNAHKIEVARDYVTNHDLSEIREVLVRIETKLDAKADK